ncbi:small multidrug resistance protein (plasmid) [Deinococcus proteolyticus MRP]|uniref:Small multidrug resistance protein n=1 Tax=Deinococcus proteolyticus (strain ATCC 35074 / DSM 20540 / JCM 6276 / NBRC 101906 / NCIMB 13154 / VKM Ac-1939 / CCM 2703 / MRP) TaxID=693977 RepID=F0RPJ2_DEIPM|nr:MULTISPECIES: multidrug efflux SMR transporter [Deinococcus]ADY27298.1 small multidrug resistance protein [Deinococcus proteolyticus MRP]MCY1704167.1 multidrug efflux SMR transporter [Deinococcus sp. SL84]
MNGWLWLGLAGLFEIGMATALKLSQTQGSYRLAFLVLAVLSFECLARAIRTIPLGLAYAIWTGIGAVGAMLLGSVLFGETLTPLRLGLLAGLLAALVGLKLSSSSAPAGPAPQESRG